jgi:hypothetical protein
MERKQGLYRMSKKLVDEAYGRGYKAAERRYKQVIAGYKAGRTKRKSKPA